MKTTLFYKPELIRTKLVRFIAKKTLDSDSMHLEIRASVPRLLQEQYNSLLNFKVDVSPTLTVVDDEFLRGTISFQDEIGTDKAFSFTISI